MTEKPCILIRVEDREIHTNQFASFHLAQCQMVDEMKLMAKIPADKFRQWNGMLMVESGDGRWAFWSDGGYLNAINPIDWQIEEINI